METLRFSVPGMTCSHCVAAVREEIEKVPGVRGVDVDLESKAVVATGTAVEAAAVKMAVDEAGYEAVEVPRARSPSSPCSPLP